MGDDMQRRRIKSRKLVQSVLATSAAVLTLVIASWAAGQEKVLYTLTAVEGEDPAASLIFDASGTLYGTAASGGLRRCGTVFALSPVGNGGWSESTLHDFGCGPSDGKSPESALVFDQSGNLYGSTASGGSNDCGVIFKLTRLSSGSWAESVVHDFGGIHGREQVDGCHPYSSLVFDVSGNLYGTTTVGGGGITEGSCNDGCGTAFELSAAKGGGWTEHVIHRFHGRNSDGENPFSGLILDGMGNLYGATFAGGTVFGGTIFKLTLKNGNWNESVLYNFQGGHDGANPYACPVFDRTGILYGTTVNGGFSDVGTVFRLAPVSVSRWKESILHSFVIGSNDGFYPFGSVIVDTAGNLYGTTEFGGAHQQGQKGAGTVFKLTPSTGGYWKEKILFNFSHREQGKQLQRNPFGGLVTDLDDNLFGTAQPSGALGGVVFEATGKGHPVP
jgi:uncharacterized repeat protein (TIGR03803 family)